MRVLALLVAVVAVCAARDDLPTVPRVEELGAEWTNMPLKAMPLVQNFHGAATLRRDVEPGFGMISLGPITSAPFNGNFQNSTVKVDGVTTRVATTAMRWCEADRKSKLKDGSDFTNTVRLPFEQHGLMQQWRIAGSHKVDMALDGPFYRQCDTETTEGKVWSACGWGTSMPTDRASFQRTVVLSKKLGLDVMIVEDSLTQTVAAAAIWASEGRGTLSISTDDARMGFTAAGSLEAGAAGTVSFRQAVMVSTSRAQALSDLEGLVGRFDEEWERACTAFNDRWRSAFAQGTGSSDPSHFSGSLPAMQSNDPDLDRLYYWAALAMVSLERTNTKTSAREFVISEGPFNSLDGSTDMGGTGQFVWDLSFASSSLSLLEPSSTKRLISYLVRYSNLTAEPMMTPQSWDAYEESPAGLGTYCFDFFTTFFLIQQYVAHTGDAGLLRTPLVNELDSSITITPLEFMRRLSWSWKAYPRSKSSPFLVDYGSNKRLFLEAVPTYTNVVPILQFGNAGMLLAMAEFLDGVSGGTSSDPEVAWMRGNATAIITDVLKYQYHEGSGYWDCLYPGKGAAGGDGRGEVRAISDFGYLGIIFGVMARNVDAIPASVRKECTRFFMDEMLGNGWVRALSLQDPVMAHVEDPNPTLEQKVAMRADWTGTGAYGGLAGISVDTLADLEGGFGSVMETMRNLSLSARVTMPAQGIAVLSPPFIGHFLNDNDGLPFPSGPYAPSFPEFFDEPDFPAWWPSSLRSVQNAEASIVDSFIRSVFGWRPDWTAAAQRHPGDARAAIDAALYLPNVSRGSGFRGTLAGVRTPYGCIDITASEAGLTWAWTKHEARRRNGASALRREPAAVV